jgi:hypothetical protein
MQIIARLVNGTFLILKSFIKQYSATSSPAVYFDPEITKVMIVGKILNITSNI